MGTAVRLKVTCASDWRINGAYVATSWNGHGTVFRCIERQTWLRQCEGRWCFTEHDGGVGAPFSEQAGVIYLGGPNPNDSTGLLAMSSPARVPFGRPLK